MTNNTLVSLITPLEKLPSNTVYVRLPNDIDFDSLTADKKLQTIKGYKKEKLYYLVSLIFQGVSDLPKENFIHRYYDDNESMAFFVPLMAKDIARIVGNNYRTYFEYLVAIGIIEIDDEFAVEEKCKAYRLNEKYRNSESIRQPIKDFTLSQKIRKGQIEKTKRERRYITSMEDKIPKLSLDTSKARKLIQEIREFDEVELSQKEISVTQRSKKQKNIEGKYFSFLRIIEQFEDQNFLKFKRNEDHLRIYSIITKLPKAFRSLITYKGEKMVQVDLKNAQFLLSLKLLYPTTWRNRRTDNFNKKIWKGLECLKANAVDTNTILQLLDNLDLNSLEYARKLANGLFYEGLIEELVEADHIKESLSFAERRKRAKKLLCNVTFDNTNIGYHRNENSVWEIFSNHHPLVVRVFDFIKQHAYKDMARILQRLEGYFMIDIVCKRLFEEFPKIPIFTLHDCIVTTEGNEEIVDRIIKEEMVKFIGFEGKTEIEAWSSFPQILYDFSKIKAA